MLRRFSRLVMTAFLAGNLLPLTAAQQLNNLDGRVFETATKRGIENLEVKLTPPTNSDLAVRLASTDQNGQFRFAPVEAGPIPARSLTGAQSALQSRNQH
jgi:hypothetical protein